MRLQPLEAKSPSEIDRAFAAMTRERADALLVLLDPIFARPRLREQIADLAARSHLPAMYALRLHLDAGGLMAYDANIFDLYRRTAIYVDKILKGAKPAELPRRAADEVRAGHQPQDREGARADDPAVTLVASG
jgi:putative ABC transport system substrate-binding protein